ncbi:hypothetical protein D3C76_1288940 [compost metagenome]
MRFVNSSISFSTLTLSSENSSLRTRCTAFCICPTEFEVSLRRAAKSRTIRSFSRSISCSAITLLSDTSIRPAVASLSKSSRSDRSGSSNSPFSCSDIASYAIQSFCNFLVNAKPRGRTISTFPFNKRSRCLTSNSSCRTLEAKSPKSNSSCISSSLHFKNFRISDDSDSKYPEL